MNRAAVIILFLASILSGEVKADCVTNSNGVVVCAPGRCVNDSNGNIVCASTPEGAIGRNSNGVVVCGAGRCVNDSNGNVV